MSLRNPGLGYNGLLLAGDPRVPAALAITKQLDALAAKLPEVDGQVHIAKIRSAVEGYRRALDKATGGEGLGGLKAK